MKLRGCRWMETRNILGDNTEGHNKKNSGYSNSADFHLVERVELGWQRKTKQTIIFWVNIINKTNQYHKVPIATHYSSSFIESMAPCWNAILPTTIKTNQQQQVQPQNINDIYTKHITPTHYSSCLKKSMAPCWRGVPSNKYKTFWLKIKQTEPDGNKFYQADTFLFYCNRCMSCEGVLDLAQRRQCLHPIRHDRTSAAQVRYPSASANGSAPTAFCDYAIPTALRANRSALRANSLTHNNYTTYHRKQCLRYV